MCAVTDENSREISVAEMICATKENVKYKKTFRGVKKIDLKKLSSIKGFTAVLKAGTERFKPGDPRWYRIVYVMKDWGLDEGGVNGIPCVAPEKNPQIPKGIKEDEIWLMEVDWQEDGTFTNPKITVKGYNHKD